jgi:hypothetical protein
MEIPILPQNMVAQLHKDIGVNIENYTADGFQTDILPYCKSIKGTKIPDNFTDLICYDEKKSAGELDAENSLIVYQSLQNLTPYQARDERVLSAISHVFLAKFAFFRHKIALDKTEKKIERHFFARSNAGRDIERYNVVGRLWWHGYFVDRCREKHSLEELVHVLCTDTDFRQSFIERPGISIIPQVALAVMLCKRKFDIENPNNSFFKGRTDISPNRRWYKMINLAGGTRLYAAMSSQELFDLFWSYMNQVAEE